MTGRIRIKLPSSAPPAPPVPPPASGSSGASEDSGGDEHSSEEEEDDDDEDEVDLDVDAEADEDEEDEEEEEEEEEEAEMIRRPSGKRAGGAIATPAAVLRRRLAKSAGLVSDDEDEDEDEDEDDASSRTSDNSARRPAPQRLQKAGRGTGRRGPGAKRGGDDDAGIDEEDEEDDDKFLEQLSKDAEVATGGAGSRLKTAKALTSRQRAYLDSQQQVEAGQPRAPLLEPTGAHVALGMGRGRGRRKAVLTEEQLLKRHESARRRKTKIEQRNEEIKAATIKKLLSKQTSRKVKEDEEQKERRREDDEARRRRLVRYVSRGPEGAVTVSFPPGLAWPLPAAGTAYPPARLCGVCKREPRRYVHRAAQMPVCSLACYSAV